MSYTYESVIPYESGGDVTYGGANQLTGQTPVPVEFAARLRRSNVRLSYLVTVEVGLHLTGWVLTPGVQPNAGYVVIPDWMVALVTRVQSNLGGDLVNDPNMGDGGGRWAILEQSGEQRLYVDPPSHSTLAENILAAKLAMRVSNLPRELRDVFWEPRLLQAPNLSVRIEDEFGGVGQLGGGRMTLANHDGFFDGMLDLDWDAGTVTIEIGVDLSANDADAMDEADYLMLGSWRIETWEFREDTFLLQLRELKSRLSDKIPYETYSRAEYPALANDDVGKPIPLAYGRVHGVEPVAIDRESKRFKVASHRIRSFDGVRIEKAIEEVLSESLDSADLAQDGNNRWTVTYRTEVVNVTFDGADLDEVNSKEAVRTTEGSWHYEGEILYVRPPSGETIDGGAWLVSLKETIRVWVPTDFASVDLALAEFTLGDEWDRNGRVSVDFSGRVLPDGQLMTNGADVAADLVDYIGEITLDETTFNAARRALHIGHDRFGWEADHLAPTLYVTEPTEALEVFSRLNSIIGGFLFVGLAGDWRFEVFRAYQGRLFDPTPGTGLRYFDESDIVDGTFSRLTDAKEVFSRVKLDYAERPAEHWRQTLEHSRPENRYRHNLTANNLADREAGLSRLGDARYYAQRFLTTEGIPRVAYRFSVLWPAFFLAPGDKIHVVYDRFSLDTILEVLDVSYDLVNGEIKVVAGDQRGWGDTFGFWESDADASAEVPQAWAQLEPEGLVYPNGALVQTWLDSSGNGRHLSQSTFASRPTFRGNVLNGYGAVEFGYNAAYLQHSYLQFLVSFAALTQAEVWILAKAENDPGAAGNVGNTLWTLPASSISGDQRWPDTAGDIQEGLFSTSVHNAGNPAAALTGWRVYNVRSRDGLYEVNLDGVSLFTTGTNTFDPAHFRPGGGVSGRYLEGMIASVWVFDRLLTAAESAALLQRLSDKYALGLSAPSGGSSAWDPAWTNAEVRHAKQNFGYWHGDDSLADSSDPRSHQASRWW